VERFKDEPYVYPAARFELTAGEADSFAERAADAASYDTEDEEAGEEQAAGPDAESAEVEPGTELDGERVEVAEDADASHRAAPPTAESISDRSGRAALPFAGKDKHMTKREIEARIALTGVKPFYTVRCSSYDGMQDVDVPNARLGNAIVRTLRALAMDRPDLFPPSAARTAAYVLAAERQA